MYTGPLQQLVTLTEVERRSLQQQEGERLCLSENPSPIAPAGSRRSDEVLVIWSTHLERFRRRLLWRRPRTV
jgi:hypothetical protein